jgi:hypothetical protein
MGSVDVKIRLISQEEVEYFIRGPERRREIQVDGGNETKPRIDEALFCKLFI